MKGNVPDNSDLEREDILVKCSQCCCGLACLLVRLARGSWTMCSELVLGLLLLNAFREELRRYGADAYPSAVACNHPTVAFGIQFDDQQAKLDLREFSRQGTNEYYLVFGDTNWAVLIQFNFQRRDPELERQQEEWTRIMTDLQDRAQAQSGRDEMFLTPGSGKGDCFGSPPSSGMPWLLSL
eukprot:3441743-Rhodomonas_salina.1